MRFENIRKLLQSREEIAYQKRSYDLFRQTYTVGAPTRVLRFGIIGFLIFVAVTIVCFTPLWIVLSRSRPGHKADEQILTEYRTFLENQTNSWKQEIYDANVQQGLAPPKPVVERTERGYIIQQIVERLAILKNESLRELQSNMQHKQLFQSVIQDICLPKPTCTTEQLKSPYRTFDGSCNNEKHPEWGMAGRQQKRHLPPKYRDGFGSPRTHGVTGDPLPSPRKISNEIHISPGNKLKDSQTTVLVMAFGQFMSHDIASTPPTDAHHLSILKCCKEMYMQSSPFNSCFPVSLPNDDTYFQDTTCMSFTRSAPAICDNCEICGREQINEMTSYVDASNVYGSAEDYGKTLKNNVHGMLMDTGVDFLLPGHRKASCRLTGSTQYCFEAGDRRVNVVPNLSSLHTAFVRFHNILALSLLKYNPHWDNEKLFQEARRILIAVMQNIVYKEYLPVILGPVIMYKYDLGVSGAYKNVYNDSVDATISNEFSTAAFRFGHNNIPDEQISLDDNYESLGVSPIESTYHNPNLTFGHCDGLTRWMVHRTGGLSDGVFSDGVRNKLFIDEKKVSLDLVSLNIQRGRDHGLAPYNSWRRFCKLPPLTTNQFSQYGTTMGDFTAENADLFRRVYGHPEDIDLYSGAIKETLLPDAQVGPTFACILATDFKAAREGDRHYFENPSLVTGFTKDQLYTIKDLSFAKVLCKTMNILRIQPSVFRPPDSDRNQLQNCDDFGDIDLKYWKSTASN